MNNCLDSQSCKIHPFAGGFKTKRWRKCRANEPAHLNSQYVKISQQFAVRSEDEGLDHFVQAQPLPLLFPKVNHEEYRKKYSQQSSSLVMNSSWSFTQSFLLGSAPFRIQIDQSDSGDAKFVPVLLLKIRLSNRNYHNLHAAQATCPISVDNLVLGSKKFRHQAHIGGLKLTWVDSGST